MSVIIGIDLGTTNFAVCSIEKGQPKMLQDSHQNRTFPSAIFLDNGHWLVGHEAKTARIKNPSSGAYAVKRLMGVKYDSEERRILKDSLGLSISQTKNGNCAIQLADRILTPSQVAALILDFAKKLVVEHYGQEPDEAVITVPAYFNHAQREATKKAAELANLACHRIINEPTAAAIAYGLKAESNTKVLVYDLGGGTFDVSILQFFDGVVETLATSGDAFLGGEDFDQVLIQWMVEEYQKQHGIALQRDKTVNQRLKDAAETAKIELSFKKEALVYLPVLQAGKDLQVTISRANYERRTLALIEKTIEIVQTALQDAELEPADIDKYLLVGGQTRMPLIQEQLTKFFHKKPQKSVHPDEVVAIGAALHAGSLQGDIDAPMLFDVTPFNLGIDIQAGLFQTIIAKNARIPVTASEKFFVRNQKTDVRIVIRQGHSRFAMENEFLGEFQFKNLALRDMGNAEVEVNFRIDANGMLQVMATDMVSGRKVKMKMRSYGEFIREDIDIEEESSEENHTEIASIGMGDSSASKKTDGIASQLAEKEEALKKIDDEVSEQELVIANSLVGELSQQETAKVTEESTMEAELAAINSLIADIEGDEQTDGEDGLALMMDLSWLEEFEDDDRSQETNKIEKAETASPATENSDAEVFVLTPDLQEDVSEEVFELQLDGQEKETVAPPNTETMNSVLDDLLYEGFDSSFELPDDDFFHGLTAIVTGKEIDTANPSPTVEASFVVDSEAMEQNLSQEMLLILEELFA